MDDLLSLAQVYEVPGVMQTGNAPFPKPALDLRKRGQISPNYPLDVLFWRRSQIESWVATLKVKK